LAVACNAARKKLCVRRTSDGKPDYTQVEVCHEEFQQQSYICFTASGYARLAQEYSHQLLVNAQTTAQASIRSWIRSLCKIAASSVCQVCDTSLMRDRKHFGYVVRNTVAIMIGFVIGKFYFKNAAVVSGTICLLMSPPSGIGSQMKKNLQRLQGVTLSKIAAQLVYFPISGCDIPSYIALSTMFFVFAFLAFFFYFTLEDSALVACLVGAYGGPILLQGCGNKIDAKGTYHEIEQTTCAILIMALVDLPFSDSASSEAQRLLMRVLHNLNDLFKRLTFEDEAHEVMMTGLQDSVPELNGAKSLGLEAVNEPRIGKVKWPIELFESATAFAHNWQSDLLSLEFSIRGSWIALPWQKLSSTASTRRVKTLGGPPSTKVGALFGPGGVLSKDWLATQAEVLAATEEAAALLERSLDREAHTEVHDQDEVGLVPCDLQHFRLIVTKLRGGGDVSTFKIAGLGMCEQGEVAGGEVEKMEKSEDGDTMYLSYRESVIPDGYVIITGSGPLEFDPVKWRLEGSADNRHWFLLHEQVRKKELPAERGAVEIFRLGLGSESHVGRAHSTPSLHTNKPGKIPRPNKSGKIPRSVSIWGEGLASSMVEKLQRAINGAKGLSFPENAPVSMEDDVFCQLSVFFLTLRSAMAHVDELERRILRHSHNVS